MSVADLREMKFRLKIDVRNFETKMTSIERFLGEGSKVRVTVMFRGGELPHPEIGRKVLDQITDRLVGIATVESAPLWDGRNLSLVLRPNDGLPDSRVSLKT